TNRQRALSIGQRASASSISLAAGLLLRQRQRPRAVAGQLARISPAGELVLAASSSRPTGSFLLWADATLTMLSSLIRWNTTRLATVGRPRQPLTPTASSATRNALWLMTAAPITAISLVARRLRHRPLPGAFSVMTRLLM